MRAAAESHVPAQAGGTGWRLKGSWLQITSIEKGRVNGLVSLVMAGQNGKTTAVTRPLSGTIEGNALNLSIENGTGLSLVTGTIDGENLRLTFFGDGNSKQVNFSKSDATKFAELANDKRQRAAENRQDIENAAAMKYRIEKRTITHKSIDQLSDSINEKSQEVHERSRRISVIIARYRIAGESSQNLRNARQRTNTVSPEGDYRTSEIDYQLDGNSRDVASTHDRVKNYTQSLNDFMAGVAPKPSMHLGKCQTDTLLNCS